jgi:hypothetical protein
VEFGKESFWLVLTAICAVAALLSLLGVFMANAAAATAMIASFRMAVTDFANRMGCPSGFEVCMPPTAAALSRVWNYPISEPSLKAFNATARP